MILANSRRPRAAAKAAAGLHRPEPSSLGPGSFGLLRHCLLGAGLLGLILAAAAMPQASAQDAPPEAPAATAAEGAAQAPAEVATEDSEQQTETQNIRPQSRTSGS